MWKSDILVKSDPSTREKNGQKRSKTRFCSVNTHFSWSKPRIFVKNGGHAGGSDPQNLQKMEKSGVKLRFLSVKTRKTPLNSRETHLKTSIFTKKWPKNKVFFREFSKITPFFRYLRNKTSILVIPAWVPPGTPSIAPRGDHQKMVDFSTLIKNETGTKPSFNQKFITKEKSGSPPTPPSGL